MAKQVMADWNMVVLPAQNFEEQPSIQEMIRRNQSSQHLNVHHPSYEVSSLWRSHRIGTPCKLENKYRVLDSGQDGM
jgi:hypothetical protein